VQRVLAGHAELLRTVAKELAAAAIVDGMTQASAVSDRTPASRTPVAEEGPPAVRPSRSHLPSAAPVRRAASADGLVMRRSWRCVPRERRSRRSRPHSE
jgi:hypothetical protein